MTINLISLGAGVQSSTLALMANQGKFAQGRPYAAIFADTGWEPKATYDYLDFLEKELDYPVYRVSAGNLRDKILDDGYSDAPFFRKGDNGKTEMGRRQCTWQFKVRPIRDKVKELLEGVGLPKKQGSVNLWIGISTDEAHRMKPADVKWLTHEWPLIDEGMNRSDCKGWLLRNGYPIPPKSSCLGCPLHSRAHWKWIKDTSPAEWNQTVEDDRELRLRGEFMVPKCVPLDEYDLGGDDNQLDMFGNECEGMCGV